jgi:hypothetical protein
MDAVIELRLQLACLEKVLAGPHCELNISVSSKTNTNGRRRMDLERKKQALQEQLVKCRILLSQFSEGATAKNLNDLVDELEQKIYALGR